MDGDVRAGSPDHHGLLEGHYVQKYRQIVSRRKDYQFRFKSEIVGAEFWYECSCGRKWLDGIRFHQFFL